MTPTAPRRTRGPLGGRRGCDACGGRIEKRVCTGCGRDLRLQLARRQRRDTIVFGLSLGGFLTAAAVALYLGYRLEGLLELSRGKYMMVSVWSPFVLGPFFLGLAVRASLSDPAAEFPNAHRHE